MRWDEIGLIGDRLGIGRVSMGIEWVGVEIWMGMGMRCRPGVLPLSRASRRWAVQEGAGCIVVPGPPGAPRVTKQTRRDRQKSCCRLTCCTRPGAGAQRSRPPPSPLTLVSFRAACALRRRARGSLSLGCVPAAAPAAPVGGTTEQREQSVRESESSECRIDRFPAIIPS